MIRENEILALMGNQIPGLRAELEKIDDKKSAYKMARCFSNFTYRSIEKRQQRLCKKCLQLAEKLYLDGERNVRQAIESVYAGFLAKSLAKRGEQLANLPVFVKEQLRKIPHSQKL